MPKRLAPTEIDKRLGDLEGWSRVGDRLRTELRFAHFRAAFAFMTEVAELAEREDHHPDWSNSYGRVTIELTTHDSGGITDLDLSVAAQIAAIARRHGGAATK